MLNHHWPSKMLISPTWGGALNSLVVVVQDLPQGRSKNHAVFSTAGGLGHGCSLPSLGVKSCSPIFGGWATPLKNMSQLGWWNSQYFWEKKLKNGPEPPSSWESFCLKSRFTQISLLKFGGSSQKAVFVRRPQGVAYPIRKKKTLVNEEFLRILLI